MPELPEVETVRRDLLPAWEGRVLSRVTVRCPSLRWPLPVDFARCLEGCRIESIERQGKYLLIRLNNGQVLLIHLGMSGRLIIAAHGPVSATLHDHVLFATDNGTVVTFRDPRRFGLMDLWPAESLTTHPLLVGLGPDLLNPMFDGCMLAAVLAGRRMAVKTALLNQKLVAGLGNIYACEALYRAGLAPNRSTSSITGAKATVLANAIKAVLREALAAGGSSIQDYVRPNGEQGYFQHALAVYGRAGQPCRACNCGGRQQVVRIVQGGRSTFFCPHKQQ